MCYMVDRTINFDHFVSSQVICVLVSLNLLRSWSCWPIHSLPNNTDDPSSDSCIRHEILSRDEESPQWIASFVEKTQKLQIPDQLRDLLRLSCARVKGVWSIPNISV